jgi:hypothetical protein
MKLANSIPQIAPERNPQLATRLLQTQKRVTAATTEGTSSARADFPLLHVLANVILRQVVVQRNFRVFENQQQMLFLGVNRPESFIELRPARGLGEESVELSFQTFPSSPTRSLSIRLQVLV